MSGVAGPEPEIKSFASLMKLDIMLKRSILLLKILLMSKLLSKCFNGFDIAKYVFSILLSQFFPTAQFWEGLIVVLRVT